MPTPLLLLAACAPSPHDSGGAVPVERLSVPCGGAAVAAIAADPDGRGWVACGERLLATGDAGRSFTAETPAPRAWIAHLVLEPDGALLACGRDLAGSGLLWRRSRTGGWVTLLQGGEGEDLTACGRVARGPAGRLAVSAPAQPGLALEGEDGTWHLPSGWVTGSEPPRVYDLAASAAGWAALAATLTGPPLFLASGSPAAPLPLVTSEPDPDLMGELGALATPDGGRIWLAGGRDLGDDDGPEAALLISADAGATWERPPLPAGLGWVRALAFAPDGRCGVAVGHRQVRGEGGFLLVTSDAGATWDEVEVALPPLRAAAALDAGFLVGGEGGYLGRGEFP